MKTPWSEVNGLAFMRDTLLNGVTKEELKSTLTVETRLDVDTRRWWTLEWTGADGTKQTVSAGTAERVFERAAEREMLLRSR